MKQPNSLLTALWIWFFAVCVSAAAVNYNLHINFSL